MPDLNDVKISNIKTGKGTIAIEYRKKRNGLEVNVIDEDNQRLTIVADGLKRSLKKKIKFNIGENCSQSSHWLSL